MDINLLVLNIGNSRVASGTFVAGELGDVTRTPVDQRGEWQKAIAAAWSRVSAAGGAIVAASVNPTLTEVIEHTVEQITGRSIVWVGREIELPIGVLTDEPDKTGVDRIVNIAAAYEQMGAACVVVDAGTAITIDFCNDNGDFVGGAILPGASLMLESLRGRIGRLPEVTLARPEGNYGRSTQQAILQGVFHCIRGGVKEMVENYAVELARWPEIIATGGDAKVLFEGWELVHAVAPDLTLYGIALAYTEHHLRHDAQ